ncbi:MAG: serine hydrolase [Candidatus Saccharibacteria bacterium]|nr:serine hydrolase [Candidatus Saccharibacteria bacterium]
MRSHKLLIGLGMIALSIIFFVVYLLFAPETAESPRQSAEQTRQAPEEEPEPEPEPPRLLNAQPVIDAWGEQQSGTYSIVVYDLENEEVIGTHNEDEVYFAASLYKLYVAYEGYLALQRGEYQASEPYQSGNTFGQCLDKMLRESDSPCAEKLWNELGKADTTAQLESYGINDTSMTAITTTAEDAATMLTRIWHGEELSAANKQKLLASLENQIYRDALAEGFKRGTFYNKVGFRGSNEYHDVGILELSNGRHYVVSVLTDGVGPRAMADLAGQLYERLDVAESP